MMAELFKDVPRDASKLTKQEKHYWIHDAAAAANSIDIENEIEPVAQFLAALEHPYANQWAFVFSVACVMADLKAQERGFRNQGDEAAQRMMARRNGMAND